MMDDDTGKSKRNESESNCRRQNLGLLLMSSSYERGHQRLQNEAAEPNETPSATRLCDLPLEIMDTILKKSYLHWIFDSSRDQRDKEVIRSLMSVDVCFYQRTARHRYKRAISRYLKDFYRKARKISAIIRSNRNYLLKNIQPNEEFIDSLISLNCITEEQRHVIQRQHSTQDKNAELLFFMESLGETTFSKFVECLRQTNQQTVAKIVASGGGVIKIKVQTSGPKRTRSIQTQLLDNKVQDLSKGSKMRSHKDEKLISRLRGEGIEILSSQLNRQTVVVWIWCHIQTAIKHVQKLYETDQLRDALFEEIQPFVPKLINIDRNQFEKTIVECPVSIDFTRSLWTPGSGEIHGVTKLRNEIYVFHRFNSSHVLQVFVDRNTCRLRKQISADQVGGARDMKSSENENCLYFLDWTGKCVWKMTIDTDDECKISKWLTIDYVSSRLSVSRNGQLLMVNDASSILMIYGSSAELVRSIQLPSDIEVYCAVKTSIGNFIILYAYRRAEKEKKGRSGSSGRKRETNSFISELNSDGQIIRNFIPSNQTQQLKGAYDLALDSDDRVFVVDSVNERVILFDSDLNWNRILCPTGDEVRARPAVPFKLCYDEEKKGFGYLIVGYDFGQPGVDVYTLTIFN